MGRVKVRSASFLSLQNLQMKNTQEDILKIRHVYERNLLHFLYRMLWKFGVCDYDNEYVAHVKMPANNYMYTGLDFDLIDFDFSQQFLVSFTKKFPALFSLTGKLILQ